MEVFGRGAPQGHTVMCPAEVASTPVTLSATASASAGTAVTPAPATVRYRGPLLDYGNVIILEPEAGIAYVDADDVVTVISPSQNITHHRHMLAHIIDRPINKVRFIMSPVGGGFGGKEDMIYQGMLALAAMKTHRPVKLVFTREESIIASAKRHPSRVTYRMGLKKNGRITAASFRMISARCVVFTPGAAHKSSTMSPGEGERSSAAPIADSS